MSSITKTMIKAMALESTGSFAEMLGRAVVAVGEANILIDADGEMAEDSRERLIDALGDEDDTAAEVLIRGLRGAFPQEDEEEDEDHRDLFETFHSEYEVCDKDGDAYMIRVETDVMVLCPELVDLVIRDPAILPGQVEWWGEWGGRHHRAECDIDEAVARGYLKSSETEDAIDSDFEVWVGNLERLVELAQEREAKADTDEDEEAEAA